MKSSTKTLITMGVLFALILGLYSFSDWFSKTTGYVLGEDEKIKLAQCLEQKEAVFYLKNNCAECEEQIEIFGETAFEFIPVVDCSSADCSYLKRIPAWEINNLFVYGKTDIEKLIRVSGCEIEQ